LNGRLIDERRTIPAYVGIDLGNQGVFGVQVEEKYGGLGLRSREVARVLEQAAGIDLGFGTFLLTSLFPGVRPIATFARDELKNELLPLLAAGRMLAGYAQTEPGAGTHFPAMAARAEARPGGGWRVTGDKVWIGNSSWAGVLTVMAHDVTAEGRKRGLTALAVRMDRPGVAIGREILSLGMRGMVQGEVSFRGVEVDESHLLGEREKGLEVGVDSMCWSRFAIAATCIGASKRAAQLVLRFAGRRQIATGRLVDHPWLRSSLGEMAAQVTLAESLLYRVAEILDEGRGVCVDAFAVCKVAGSEFLWSAADRLVQVLASRGYDEANGVPQLLRDARVTRIFEGTTEALLAFVGSQALVPTSDLYVFLRDELGGGDVADALERAVRALRGRRFEGAPAAPEPPRPWQCALAGWAAVWALVVAATAQAAERTAGPASALALEWGRLELEKACARAASAPSEERAILDVGAAEACVAAFESSIGDVEPTMPGAREERDALLRRDG
jgi:alkylation response protein AidB-like acyl-CoA dehydrogenase